MQLRLLCAGDLVGLPGRRVLRSALGALIKSREIDCVIVNAENAAGGSGLTTSLHQKMIADGVNLVTLGDHVYRRKECISVLEREDNIVRPANLPSQAPGKEFAIYETNSGHRVAVISLLGRLFMRLPVNCPFAAADRVLAAIPKDVRIVVVDMHAEATSEKIALGWHLDGRVSAVVGTHTHVPTADERVLGKGTAYITDLGMTGPYDSVLGRVKERVVSSMVTSVPSKFDVATDDVRLCGVIITVETTTGLATSIERIRFDEPVES
ncbi:MAG: TIGR00282 family metallophosphoesterase [Phycisphaerales bacterium]|nr:MAG: TIGR00282 family metallophosphoesterase [Phycisphaerales bacterium]